MREAGPVAEEAPELQVGVDPGLHSAEELQNKSVAVDHRCVGLLGSEDGRFEEVSCHAEQRPEVLRRGSDHLTERPGEPAAARNEIEEGKGETTVHHCVVQQPLLFESISRDVHSRDRLDRRTRRPARSRGEGDRQHIGLGLALSVGRPDQQDVGHRRVVRHRDGLSDLGCLDGPGLAGEPTASAEIAGKNGLQCGLVPAPEHVLPCAAHRECGYRGAPRRATDGLGPLRR